MLSLVSMSNELFIGLAIVSDSLLGDPSWLIHPVVIMGDLITRLDKMLNSGSHRRLKGIVCVLLVVLSTYLSGLCVLYLATILPAYVGSVLIIWFMSTTLAVRSLKTHAMRVLQALIAEDIPTARKYVSYIVGRDTEDLNAGEITRAVVETIAESTVDGITAPLFYLCLFGLPGALVYKAINTMDSMIGYRDSRYRDFGWAAARLDDAANYIPARVTTLLLLLVAFIHPKLRFKNAVMAVIRDAGKHPSPNSGIIEAAYAGALGVQLGGVNYYNGIRSERGKLGIPHRALRSLHIQEAIKLMQLSSYSFSLIGLSILLVLR